MKTFKQYIEERTRTPAEGKKLLRYIRQRQVKYTKNVFKMPVKGEINTKQKATYVSDVRDHPDAYKKRVAKNADISRLKDAQGSIEIDRAVEIMNAMHSGKELPPVKVSSQYNGKKNDYPIADGHHRIMAARLLGRKTINAEVNKPKE
jgi:hypothetical protein